MSLLRVTTEGEIVNRGYSFYAQSCTIAGSAYAFCGHTDGQVHFYQIDGDTIAPLGPLLPYRGTGEGWYFASGGWIYLPVGPTLRRYHLISGQDELVFDYGDGSCRLWQAHSSDDGQTHSATVQRVTSDGPYQNLGTVVARPGRQVFYSSQGILDESQVDASGAYLIIKEDDDNRIITLDTGEERRLTDADGAVGHSDVGQGFMVGEDNIRGVCVRWDLAALTRQDLFPTWNLGHIAIRGSFGIVSDPQILSLLDLHTGSLSPLTPHGFDASDYDHQCFANIDPTGSLVAFVGQVEAPRNDLYLWTL